MRRGLILLAGLTLAMTACSGHAGTPEPVASVPPAPEAPAGWASAISFGGAGGTGMTGAEVVLSDAPVAVHAACAGSGTLVLLLSSSAPGQAAPVTGTSVVFECGANGTTSDARVELTDAPSGDITASAFVLEGAGVSAQAAFNISLEQRAQTSDTSH